MSYRALERRIAEYATRFPIAKALAKHAYQTIMYLIYRKQYSTWIRDGFHLGKGCGDADHGSFFGYYTLISRSQNGQLWHRFPLKLGTTIRSTQPIDIMLDEQPIGSTTAWNWQQGSMLHWYDSNTVVWNDFDECRKIWVARIYRSGVTESRDFPIYATNATSGLVVCLDFHRLARFRPDYGYFNLPWRDLPPLSNEDGISIRSFEDGKLLQFIPIQRIINKNQNLTESPIFHKLNHAIISPNGKRVMFLHRWRNQNGIKWSRLFSYEISSDELTFLAHERMISHCCWDGDDAIIGWMRGNSGDHYYRIDLKTGQSAALGVCELTEDGHPSLSKCGRWLLTDTYPSRDRMSSLIIYDRQLDKSYIIGRFFNPLAYHGERRCDLHPRWSEDGKSISFDSVHEGIRRMYTVKFDPSTLEIGDAT